MFENIETPCYVIDCDKIEKNCNILKHVKDKTRCGILLAQKAFSCYRVYPTIARYIDGTTASGLFEARLGYEEFNSLGDPPHPANGGCALRDSGRLEKETHVFAPAYTDKDFAELIKICGHMSFNSLPQWEKYREKLPANIHAFLRVNPLYSEVEKEIYNPCAKGSRLGIPPEKLKNYDTRGISGLHFHTLCEQGADVLERTLPHIEKHFGKILPQMEFLNMGGGHHITKKGYNVEKLIQIVNYAQKKYEVKVYLEPGEAVALNAGYLIASVLDIIEGDEFSCAILDASAACHMPDVLEMPYRPNVVGGGKIGEKPYNYRFGGNTCLAGDIIGDYSFDEPLQIGGKLIFEDMAIYSMVKNNTFNGIKLPSIALLKNEGIEVIKNFEYEDFKMRL